MERRSFLKNSMFALFSAAISSNKVLATVADTLTPESLKVMLYLVQTNDGQWKVKATKWIDLYEKRLKACFVKPETFKLLDIVDYDVANTRKVELWKQYNCTGRLTKIKIIEDSINGRKAINSENYLTYLQSDKFKLNKKKRSAAAGKLRGKILGQENLDKGVDFKALSAKGAAAMKNMSPEMRLQYAARASKIHKGRKRSAEVRENIRRACIGRPSPMKDRKHTVQSKEKMSQSGKVKIFTQQHRDNMSKANSGHKNPFYGKKHTQEALQLIKDKHPSKIKVTCEHCKKEFDLANYKRSHGDKCKLANIDKYNEKFLLSDQSISIINLLENNVKYKDITKITGHSKNTIIKTNRIYKSVFG
jgi:hypothetical protein